MGRKHGVVAAGIVAGLVLAAAAALAVLEKLETAAERDSIGVFDVVVDKEHRAWADIVFDHPVATARLGPVLSPPPATIDPDTPGVWRWRAENVLRFEPQGGFNIGSIFTVALKTQRFIAAGERFRGDGHVIVKIDRLMVEKVVTTEEVAGDRKAVVLHGEIPFNYLVEPAMLVTQAALIDGGERQPIEIVDPGGARYTLGFRTRPIAPRGAARTVKLVIAKGMPETWRGARLEEEYSTDIKIGSSAHLAVRSVEPQSNAGDSALRIELSSPVNPEVVAKFVSVTPAAKYHVSAQGNDVFLTGGFAPGTQVKLAIAKGLPGIDDAVLDAPYESTVTFPALPPFLDFQSEGMFLSASGYKTVAIDSVNVAGATLAIDRVYRNNVFDLMVNDYWYPYRNYNDDDEEESDAGVESVQPVSHRLGDAIARKKLALRNVKNRKSVTTVSLERYVKAHEPGLYRVVLTSGATEQKTRWILITDLGIVAKRGADGLLVWVSSFSDLGAVDGATVTLISDQNQIPGRSRTDARGMWELRDLGKTKKQPFMLQVQKGNDFSFLVFGKTEIDLSPFDVAGDTPAKDGYSAFVYGERDIYRPGETVQGVAVVRTRALEPPPHMPLVLKHFDADQERESQRITGGDGGVASFKLDLPAYARTGRHRVDVIAGKDVIGTYNFQVEEFVPDRIKVEIKSKPAATQSVDLDVLER